MKRSLKIALFVVAGLAAGAAFARLDLPGFKFAMVTIKKGANSRPILTGAGGGRCVLALSMKNLQKASDIGIRADGAKVLSWYPPVVRMPYGHSPDFRDGRFTGAGFGETLPVYIVFNNIGGTSPRGPGNKKIEIVDSRDGSLIRTIDVLGGNGHEKQKHH
ncbi:MAG: hypothetical protein M0Z58_06445 [Nitrospiraceae bacterium]|nr:hypothetical protein [Nitrospiraceae bacterium]